jgi:hypothetical protein
MTLKRNEEPVIQHYWDVPHKHTHLDELQSQLEAVQAFKRNNRNSPVSISAAQCFPIRCRRFQQRGSDHVRAAVDTS